MWRVPYDRIRLLAFTDVSKAAQLYDGYIISTLAIFDE